MSKKILVAKRENVDSWYSEEAVKLARAHEGGGERLGELIRRLHPHHPQFIHHYTSANSLNDILRTPASLLLSQIGFTNDYKEYEHGFAIISDELDAMIAAGPKPARAVALKCLQTRLGYVREKTAVFIASFSAGDDKLSQWRGYAKNGFAIGFAYAELAKAAQDDPSGHMLLPCFYEPEEHVALARCAIETGVASYTSFSGKHPVDLVEKIAGLLFEVICTLVAPTMKAAAFEEEAEYRLVSPPLHVLRHVVPESLLEFYTSGRQLVPRIRFPLHTKDGIPLIRRVTIGPPPSDDSVKTGLLWSLAERGFEGAEIWESEVTYR